MPLQPGCFDESPFFQEGCRDISQEKPTLEEVKIIFKRTGNNSVLVLGENDFQCKHCGKRHYDALDAFDCCFWLNVKEN